MKAERVKVGHIYFVDFEPHRTKEFDKKHLAIVLKKNYDEITFIVVPLTGTLGDKVNKLSLGVLECLPKNLQSKESYAVIDQVRTVSASRFMALYEDGVEYDAAVPEEVMVKIYKAIIRDLLHDVPKESLLQILL